MSTEEQGYGVARTKFGAFTVAATAVNPYLDGFKVRLRIGNLTSADFDGAKISVSWGAGAKKEFTVTNQFRAGSFTEVEVALTPAKAEDVKTLSVGIELDQLGLRVR